VIDSLIEQFELFRYDSQQQMDQIQQKIAELEKDNRELKGRLSQ
jgi:hypothetical protein